MQKTTSFKKYIIILLIPLIMIAIWMIIFDPFFHYHKPLKGLSYSLTDERYQNDGIVKHFSYEAIISGSSVTQNFKASEFDALWNTTTVKTCFAGASFKEVDELIRTALVNNKEINYVLRSLDLNMINAESDSMTYTDYPKYLYDSNPLNDYKYIYNKEIFLRSCYNVINTVSGKKSTTFDDYSSFYTLHPFGKEAMMATFERQKKIEGPSNHLTDDERAIINKNLTENIIKTAKENPDVIFYYFIPPYSVCYWDALIRTNDFEKVYEILEYATSILIDQENIKLYSFNDQIDITSNLDNYMDTLHYSEKINSYILECISNEAGLLNKSNYNDRLSIEKEIYANYDYDAIFME